MITYRPAHPKNDMNFARRTHHVSYHDVIVRQFGSWDEELQEKFFREGWARAPHQVILLDGEPVGVVSVEEFADHIFIHEIQIQPDFQNKGIGSQILREQIEKARQSGKKIKLKVLRENYARKLYERMGFISLGQRDVHFMMEWRG